jgi:high-affinity Fe2+/Pb2+ permease
MKKKGWLTGIALIGACALCCAIPLIGGAAALGLSSFFLEPIFIGVLALVLIVGGVYIYKRRRSNRSSCLTTGCNCNSCAAK